MLNSEGQMGDSGMVAIAFVLGIIVTYLLLTYQEGKTSWTLTQKIERIENRTKELEKKQAADEAKVILLKVKNEEIYKDLQCQKTEVSRQQGEMDAELDKLQDHCSRLREQQIELREKLSAKRPQVNVNVPIPVTLSPAKADPKIISKLKKQMKDLN